MISLITLLLVMIERNSTTFNLIANCRRRAAQFASIALIEQPSFKRVWITTRSSNDKCLPLTC